MNLQAHEIVRRPMVTEKGTWAMNEQNRYTFEVDGRASKSDIKGAVEKLYKVKVAKVNTQVRKGVHKRLKYGVVQLPDVKTAIVKLQEGATIDLF